MISTTVAWPVEQHDLLFLDSIPDGQKLPPANTSVMHGVLVVAGLKLALVKHSVVIVRMMFPGD